MPEVSASLGLRLAECCLIVVKKSPEYRGLFAVWTLESNLEHSVSASVSNSSNKNESL